MVSMSTQPWYVDAFTADYLDVYAHRDAPSAAREAKGALSLMGHSRANDRLLDLAAGAGRHAQAFLAERCHVTCLDLSEDLTERSRKAGLRTVRGDMRHLPFRDWAFDSVACLFSSFGYFHDEPDHAITLGEIARVLSPGGRVLLDLMDPDTVAATLVPQGLDMMGDFIVEVERGMTRDGKRVEKSIRLVRGDRCEKAWVESVRLFTEDELEDLAADARLEPVSVSGDYDGRPHVAGQTRRLMVLRKPK
jgi:SAM-dependent methyltransferase